MRKLLFCLFTILSFSFANTSTPSINQQITLEYLKKQPAGISRDFYIWLFLQQNISAKEAKEAYNLAVKKNTKLFGAYFKKSDNKTLSRKTICQRMPLEKLIKQDAKCIALALKTKNAESLDKKTLSTLATQTAKHNAKLSQELKILASKDPFKTLITHDARTFSGFYFAISQNYRNKLNFTLPKDTFIKLLKEQNASFSKALRHIILTPSLDKLNRSFNAALPSEILPFLDAESSFYLGINAIRFDKKQNALQYFLHSKKNSKYSFNKNRATFWAYLASGDEKYLQELNNSKSVDIYTLASLEKTQAEPKFKIIYEIKTQNKKAKWDTKDPFEWERIKADFKNLKHKKEESKKILAHVDNEQTQAHFVWLNKERGSEYFLMPYKEVFSRFPNKEALLYSLARQESLFIPTAISTSYALGLMQLMPFNVVAIAKELKEENKVSYFDMFDPAINIPYAEYFTRPLVREFNHPLFIAYAYNGGPGFTRRLLAKNYLFKKDNPLDPWLSMELIPYEESRVYGKKVLANYIIYQKRLGKDIKLLDLLAQTQIY